MDGQELVNMTVMIAGRPYPLKIRKPDEPNIRAIAQDINDKISQYQVTYKNKDKQDCLSMAVLTYAVDLQKAKITLSQYDSIAKRLSELDNLLDQLIE